MAQSEKRFSLTTIAPYFDLPSTRGGRVKSWDFKQRKNMLIYFFRGADCEECKQTLRVLAENYGVYEKLNTEVIAIGADDLRSLTALAGESGIPFPVLSDATGEIAAKYTQVDAESGRPKSSIFLADRYGALEGEWVAEVEADLPSQDELMAILQLLELRCPE